MHNLKSEVRKAIDSLIQHRCWEGLVLKIKEQELKTRVARGSQGGAGASVEVRAMRIARGMGF